MVSAQDAFASLLRVEIAPRLRGLGFRGSGQVYILPDDRRWAMVGFQRSRSSDREHVRFTVNLTCVDKAAWDAALVTDPWMGRRPTGNGRSPVGRYERLGMVMPDHRDRWWEIGPGADAAPLATRIVAAIEAYAIPWLLDGSDHP